MAVRSRPASDMDAVLARVLGVRRLRVLTPHLEERQAASEQWDDGYNLLAVAPARVVAYERAEGTNDYRRSQGIEMR